MLHGFEIDLPFDDLVLLNDYGFACYNGQWRTCVDVAMNYPSGWVFALPFWGSTVDFGGSNELRHLTAVRFNWAEFSLGARSFAVIQPPAGADFVVVSRATGFIANANRPARVRGSVQFLGVRRATTSGPSSYPGNVVLAVQTYDDATGMWQDAATRSVTMVPATSATTNPQYYELEAVIPFDQSVRFEVRVQQHATADLDYYLYAVRMFGAQCYPDFENGAACL